MTEGIRAHVDCRSAAPSAMHCTRSAMRTTASSPRLEWARALSALTYKRAAASAASIARKVGVRSPGEYFKTNSAASGRGSRTALRGMAAVGTWIVLPSERAHAGSEYGGAVGCLRHSAWGYA